MDAALLDDVQRQGRVIVAALIKAHAHPQAQLGEFGQALVGVVPLGQIRLDVQIVLNPGGFFGLPGQVYRPAAQHGPLFGFGLFCQVDDTALVCGAAGFFVCSLRNLPPGVADHFQAFRRRCGLGNAHHHPQHLFAASRYGHPYPAARLQPGAAFVVLRHAEPVFFAIRLEFDEHHLHAKVTPCCLNYTCYLRW